MGNAFTHTLTDNFLATRHYARELRRRIEAEAPVDAEIVLDFSEVWAATLGFLDELVCNLAAGRPVTVCGMAEDLAADVAIAVERRGLGGRVTRA